MDNILQALLSISFVFACLAIAAATFIIRQFVEFILDKPWIPATKASVVWKGLILPILPVLLGAFFGYFNNTYSYPECLNSCSGRTVFGLVAGLFSGLVYRVLKATLMNKIPENSQ